MKTKNYLKLIKKFLMLISFTSLLVLFFPGDLFSLYGEIAWKLLLVIMFTSPLYTISPKCKIFSFIMMLRKELGIIIGVFAIAHAAGYFLAYKLGISFLFDSIMWDLRGYLGWGTMALVVTIPLLLTSNNFSMKKFGKNWKRIQYLAYLMLVFTAVHIALVDPEKKIPLTIVLTTYIVLKIIAYKKKKKK